MFSDDIYIDALGRQAAAVDTAVVAHNQDLVDGLDATESAVIVAYEVARYGDMMSRATAVQLIVHAAERAQSFHSR